MSVSQKPSLSAFVTFLSAEEGGRSTPACNTHLYRPHLIVGDPAQRGTVTAGGEDYLGTCFTGGGESLAPGQRHEVLLQLVYFPDVSYEKLVSGATFTIREGGRIVGYGSIKDGYERLDRRS